jgi:glycosyltransferase involved in cell wall biosynthesis
VTDRVRFAGWVPAEDLEGLWALASCAAFPTLAEGFGIPLIEAMDRGVPLAGSDIPVLREVGGEVPRFFDPHDPASAARAIDAAMSADRDDPRVAAGRARAAKYTWAAAAEATFGAYRRALSSSAGG